MAKVQPISPTFEANYRMRSTDYRMTAQTMFGLEEILMKELVKLGGREVQKHNRAVSFVGDKGFMYKANLCLRTALRILVPVHSFRARNEKEFYDGIRKLEWEDYMGVDDTLAVNAAVNSEYFNHSQYLSQKAKDAIVDQFRDKYNKRPSVDLEFPTLRIHVFVNDDSVTVSLDSSGESLHKRGYRDLTNLAPINEVLAAGLVLLSGWDGKRNFIDPMCGAGTLLIEAALFANNIPPGSFRKSFGFQRWKNYDKTLWSQIHAAAINKIVPSEAKILGGEISRNVARKAIANMHEAKLEDVVEICTSDFADLEPLPGGGVLMINPPYGERMDKDEDILALYKSIGDTLKKKWAGYEAWIITSNAEAAKAIRLNPSRRIKLFNGALECRFMKFELYSGTRRKDKLAERDGGTERADSPAE